MVSRMKRHLIFLTVIALGVLAVAAHVAREPSDRLRPIRCSNAAEHLTCSDWDINRYSLKGGRNPYSSGRGGCQATCQGWSSADRKAGAATDRPAFSARASRLCNVAAIPGERSPRPHRANARARAMKNSLQGSGSETV